MLRAGGVVAPLSLPASSLNLPTKCLSKDWSLLDGVFAAILRVDPDVCL